MNPVRDHWQTSPSALVWINGAVAAIAAATRAGTAFVFGYMGGGPLPFELKTPGTEFSPAFRALPVVLVMSVVSSVGHRTMSASCQ